jgi:SAM-dependent methyltransferase
MPDLKRIEKMSKEVRKYVQTNSKILELGCGTHKINIPGSNVVGLDASKLSGVNVVHNLEKTPLPFKDNEFDVVFSYAVLEHIKNLIPLIEDIHRILKPTGKFILYVPHFAGLGAFYLTHKNYFSADSFGIFLPENTDFNFETKARFNIIERKITFRSIFKPFEILFNLNHLIRKIYEGTILKNIIPPTMIFVVMEKTTD